MKFIHVYTGEGKGKTTAAIGQTIRLLGNGYDVLFACFLKVKSGEYEILKNLDGLNVKFFGVEGFELSNDMINEVKNGWEFVVNKIVDVVVLDEISWVVKFGIIPVDAVLKFICGSKSSFILTGRDMPKELVEVASLVSDVKEVKHPFKLNIPARKGVEF